MALTIAGRSLERIALVDDDKSVRDIYEMTLEELPVTFVNIPGPLPDLAAFGRQSREQSDAAVCDFRLRVKSYSTSFDGAELVAHWFDLGFPAVLCTKYDRASVDDLRRYRDKIPALLNASELDPDRVVEGLTVCIRELGGAPPDSRKVYRTLVRIEEITDDHTPYVFVVVPTWNPSEIVRLPLSDIPGNVQPLVKPEARLYAQVNVGAQSYEDLFFRSWEER